jgi:hypothetical protein
MPPLSLLIVQTYQESRNVSTRKHIAAIIHRIPVTGNDTEGVWPCSRTCPQLARLRVLCPRARATLAARSAFGSGGRGAPSRRRDCFAAQLAHHLEEAASAQQRPPGPRWSPWTKGLVSLSPDARPEGLHGRYTVVEIVCPSMYVTITLYRSVSLHVGVHLPTDLATRGAPRATPQARGRITGTPVSLPGARGPAPHCTRSRRS